MSDFKIILPTHNHKAVEEEMEPLLEDGYVSYELVEHPTGIEVIVSFADLFDCAERLLFEDKISGKAREGETIESRLRKYVYEFIEKIIKIERRFQLAHINERK